MNQNTFLFLLGRNIPDLDLYLKQLGNFYQIYNNFPTQNYSKLKKTQ